MSNPQEVRIVVISDDEVDLAAVGERSGLQRGDQAVIRDLAIDPITAAVLIGSAIALGKFIMRVVNEWRGGVKLDLQTAPPTVARDQAIPYGMVFVFGKDGKVDIQVKDEATDATERMFEALFKLPINATVDTIKAAIEAAKSARRAANPAGL